MPGWLTWLAALPFVTGEGAFLAAFGVPGAAIQSGLIVTILLGLRREFISGALTLAALLPFVEWAAGGPAGFYGLGLAVVFVLLQGVRRQLHREWGFGHLLVGGLAALIHPLLVVGALETFRGGAFPSGAVLWALPSGTVAVLVALWPAQWLLARADAVWEGRSRDPIFN